MLTSSVTLSDVERTAIPEPRLPNDVAVLRDRSVKYWACTGSYSSPAGHAVLASDKTIPPG
ncbi:MAG: hypothetical protein U0798_20825 [Gemmataceae bacterium]